MSDPIPPGCTSGNAPPNASAGADDDDDDIVDRTSKAGSSAVRRLGSSSGSVRSSLSGRVSQPVAKAAANSTSSSAKGHVEKKETTERRAIQAEEVRERRRGKFFVEDKSADSTSESSAKQASDELNTKARERAQAQKQELTVVGHTLFSITRSISSLQRVTTATCNLLRRLSQLPVGKLEYQAFCEVAIKLITTISTELDMRTCSEEDLNERKRVIGVYYLYCHSFISRAIRIPEVNKLSLTPAQSNSPTSFSELCEDWKRAMISATLVDCGFPSCEVLASMPQGEDLSEEALALESHNMFNQRASQYVKASTVRKNLLSNFPNHHLFELELKDTSQRTRKVQFHAAEICSTTLSPYIPARDSLNLPDGKLNPDLKIPVRGSLNCYSFAAGYEAEDEHPLIPGALSGSDKTHPIGWMADKSLRDQGLVRVDSLLCPNFDFNFLESVAAPFYLVAIIHTGKETGAPDAHVMRCFYDRHDDRVIWLQSGGKKEVALVHNSEGLVTGIPRDPVEHFCRADYPCFLGYYLVPDSVDIQSPSGAKSSFVG